MEKKTHQVTKEERFKRLAEKRVNKAITAIRSVENLSNKRNYSYNVDQATQIISAIRNSLEQLENSFGGAAEDKTFKLD